MDKQSMIQKLNEDLAGELGAIVQYITYAAKATGPYRPELSKFFLAEVADEQRSGCRVVADVALARRDRKAPRRIE